MNIKHILGRALCLLLCLTTHHAAAQTAKEMARMLEDFVKQEEVHPDSIEPNIKRMEQRLASTTDPTERAVTEAVVGYLYHSKKSGTGYTGQSALDYAKEGNEHFQRAFSNLDVLGNARLKDWLPLLEEGRDDRLYGSDMLMPLWRSAKEMSDWRYLPSHSSLFAHYGARHNREAQLLVMLDSITNAYYIKKEEALVHLKDTYSDLSLCAEVYLALSDNARSDTARARWLREGLAAYPRYTRKSALDNRLKQLCTPQLSVRMDASKIFYPGQDYKWVFTGRNVERADICIYKAKGTIDRKLFGSEKNTYEKYAREHGSLVKQFTHTFPTLQPEQTFRDTITYTAPDLGLYIVVVKPVSKVNFARKSHDCGMVFAVSRIGVEQLPLSNSQQRIMVVDRHTGAPIPGATVTIAGKQSTTDKRGMVTTKDKKNRTTIRVEKGNDRWWPESNLPWSLTYSPRDTMIDIQLYADRAIYRPGQTVHVGGVMRRRNHWQETALKGRQVRLVLYGTKEIASKVAVTDEMGTMTADFALPQDLLPGNYTISTDYSSLRIRVEEYKRPTFEVKMDDAPAMQWPADSITLTGMATTYAGVPVHGARVTGSYQWTRPWWRWWYSPYSDNLPPSKDIDTLTTDELGRFAVRIPLKDMHERLTYGMNISLNVDVLSPTGETQAGHITTHICSSPLRLSANVPTLLEKGSMKPWEMELVSSTGKTVEGQLRITLTQDKKKILEVLEKSGTAVLPEGITQLPSGRYDLKVVGTCGGDSAVYHRSVTFFSMADPTIPADTLLWWYTPSATFSASKPAQLQVGSSREGAYIYCVVASNDGLVVDTIYQSATAQAHTSNLITIPYKPEYKDGITATAFTYWRGKSHSESCQFLLQTPDKELKHRWVTFRNRLQPGQQETWKLQLTRPDGTPADAQLMATIYDASLEQLARNTWTISHTFNHYLNNFRHSEVSANHFANLYGSNYAGYDVSLKEAPEYRFSTLNRQLFEGAPMVMYAPGIKYRTNMRFKEMAVHEAVPMAMAAPKALREMNTPLMSKATGAMKDSDGAATAETESTEAEEQETAPAIPLRSNFEETAAFLPQLRADSEGIVSLQFTLPESMTTWRLNALAHTKDMMTAIITEDIIAQKDLMAQLSLPRFLRQGDESAIVATLHNVSTQPQQGKGYLTILDAKTEKQLAIHKVDFRLRAESDTVVRFPIQTREGVDTYIIRWVAEGTTCSDGEQRYLPILSSQQYVTASRTLTYHTPGTYTERINDLFPKRGATHKRLAVEYTTNPIWLAVQTMPSLVWPDYDDVLSLATAYYADGISRHLSQIYPAIKQGIEAMSEVATGLNASDEVRSLQIRETPWVAEAEREAKRKERLSSLFDDATQESLLKQHLDKLRGCQLSDGSFTWYPGMKGSHYLTLETAYLLTRLKVLTGSAPHDMLSRATAYLRTKHPTQLCHTSLRYLYIIGHNRNGMTKDDRHNADSLIKALTKVDLDKKDWRKHLPWFSHEECALAAIVLQQWGKDKAARRYLDEVKRLLVSTPDKGTYIEHPRGAFTSINRRMHIHVQIMEALQSVTPTDTALIRGMQQYLLTQKRTQDWETPVTTANAIYALLQGQSALLNEGANDVVRLQMAGGKTQAYAADDTSLGYIHQVVEAEKTPQSLTITKQGKGESWGAIYAQYQQPIHEVEARSEGLQVSREYSTLTPRVGDRIHVRYIVTADRDYEYVMLRAPHPATCEPARKLSTYMWQNGVGYYRALHDASTDYFFDTLPRGTYVIEEDYYVEREGTYHTAPTTVECMYAPEYRANTGNEQLTVNN